MHTFLQVVGYSVSAPPTDCQLLPLLSKLGAAMIPLQKTSISHVSPLKVAGRKNFPLSWVHIGGSFDSLLPRRVGVFHGVPIGAGPAWFHRTFADPQVTADDHGEHRIYNVQVQLDDSQTERHGNNGAPMWAMP